MNENSKTLKKEKKRKETHNKTKEQKTSKGDLTQTSGQKESVSKFYFLFSVQ